MTVKKKKKKNLKLVEKDQTLKQEEEKKLTQMLGQVLAMREPSRKSAEYHRFRPDSGCLLYFEMHMAATAISNNRDPKTALLLLIISKLSKNLRPMCQQEGVKLRFVLRSTPPQGQKNNVSVSLRGEKKTDSAVLFSCFLQVCYPNFRNARVVICNYPAKMRNMAKCYLEYDILHWRTTTYKGRLTL